MIPTPGSTRSSFRERPAPRITEATPALYASMRRTNPARLPSASAGARWPRAVPSRDGAGPRCLPPGTRHSAGNAPTHCRPPAASGQGPRPHGESCVTPPRESIHPAWQIARSTSSFGPLPWRHSMHSRTSRKLPIGQPQRLVHVGDHGGDLPLRGPRPWQPGSARGPAPGRGPS